MFIYFLLLSLFLLLFFKKNNFFYNIFDTKYFMINISIDYWSKLFISAVLFISIMIFLYMNFYMKEEFFLKRFYFLVFWFIFSMIILLISNNFFTLFIGWDGLGVSSYFLVVYYQNWKSMNAGLVTILSNRIGDCLFMLIMIYLISLFSIDKINNYVFMIFMFSMVFILFSFTKSAQYPFSAWLPAAMAAPTPVSSLVHSSTLVTAGFYLLFRFFYFNFNLMIVMMTIIISFMTLLYSGMNGLLEMDFKKIIALSTLSQLSLMFISLSINMKMMSYFHLFTHAFFKSVLFMSVGVIIHFFFNNQDMRNYNYVFLNILKVSMFLSIFSLMGLFFSSGFFSKDFILEKIFMKKSSMMIVWLFFFMMFLTMFYSIRLLKTMLFINTSNKMFYYSFSNKLFLSLIILSILSLIIGNMLNWNFLYFVWIFCFIKYKFFVFMIFMNSILIYFFYNKINLLKMFFLMNSMLFLVKITFFFNFFMFFMKKMFSQLLEKSILEIYENNNFFKMMNMNLLFSVKNYFVYLIMMMILFTFLFLI